MTLNWVIYGILAALSFAGMTLTIKKILTLNVSPVILNFFLFGFAFIGFSVWTYIKKDSINISLTVFLFLLLATFFALLGNFFDVTALKFAPNPGYASTLKATQIVIITLVSPFLFSSSLTGYKFIGIIFVLIGAFLVSF